MYLCYIDESGVPEVPGNSTHFVLAGLTLPIWHWRDADRQVGAIMRRYGLANAELHTAWLRRKYPEQEKVPGFAQLGYDARRFAVRQVRAAHLLKLRQTGQSKTYQQAKKNFAKSEEYTHLTYDDRINLTREVADCIGGWGFARLFAECIDKLHFNPARTGRTIEQQAFEQVVSRFERYLQNLSRGTPQKNYGLLIHDNNQTVATKHTHLMRDFHRQGTLWTGVDHIIETPLFVNSSLTSMVQAADLCAYALRRFVEFKDGDLFQRIFPRADRMGTYTVGIRHFSLTTCVCVICDSHN
ncbi:MAG TPA: DUF3800 domain-containing protein [Rhizomicrobium sp.]|nr:DUF3800 domain-containing protein [Rhizomicrobium sp.]